MSLPQRVKLVEVGPRDGLQNEPREVPTAVKIELIERLTDAGLPAIESGSFVSPKWVPRMADSGEVLRGIRRRPGVSYPVLVPNLRGFEAAMEARCEEVAVFAADSEAFSQKNTNCSIAESLARFEPVLGAAREHGVSVRGYVSCVLGCPYQGEVTAQAAADVAAALYDMGCYEVSLGDTIGTGSALKTQRLFEAAARRVPVERLAGHFHDTYGQAVANVFAAMQMGVSVFDCSIAGLGGCPYAKGATGNVATEDVVYQLSECGIDTGIDLQLLIEVGAFISDALQRTNNSRAGRALLAKRK